MIEIGRFAGDAITRDCARPRTPRRTVSSRSWTPATGLEPLGLVRPKPGCISSWALTCLLDGRGVIINITLTAALSLTPTMNFRGSTGSTSILFHPLRYQNGSPTTINHAVTCTHALHCIELTLATLHNGFGFEIISLTVFRRTSCHAKELRPCYDLHELLRGATKFEPDFKSTCVRSYKCKYRISDLQSVQTTFAPYYTSIQICIALVCGPVHLKKNACQPAFIMSRLHRRKSLQRELLSEHLPYPPFYFNYRMVCSSWCIPCSTTGIDWASSSNERPYCLPLVEQTPLQMDCTLPCLSVLQEEADEAFNCFNLTYKLHVHTAEYIVAAPAHFQVGLLALTFTAKHPKTMIISRDSDYAASKRYLPIVHRLSSFDLVYLTSLELVATFVDISADIDYNGPLFVAYQHTSRFQDLIRSIYFCHSKMREIPGYSCLTLASTNEAVVNYIRLQLASVKTHGSINTVTAVTSISTSKRAVNDTGLVQFLMSSLSSASTAKWVHAPSALHLHTFGSQILTCSDTHHTHVPVGSASSDLDVMGSKYATCGIIAEMTHYARVSSEYGEVDTTFLVDTTCYSSPSALVDLPVTLLELQGSITGKPYHARVASILDIGKSKLAESKSIIPGGVFYPILLPRKPVNEIALVASFKAPSNFNGATIEYFVVEPYNSPYRLHLPKLSHATWAISQLLISASSLNSILAYTRCVSVLDGLIHYFKVTTTLKFGTENRPRGRYVVITGRCSRPQHNFYRFQCKINYRNCFSVDPFMSTVLLHRLRLFDSPMHLLLFKPSSRPSFNCITRMSVKNRSLLLWIKPLSLSQNYFRVQLTQDHEMISLCSFDAAVGCSYSSAGNTTQIQFDLRAYDFSWSLREHELFITPLLSRKPIRFAHSDAVLTTWCPNMFSTDGKWFSIQSKPFDIQACDIRLTVGLNSTAKFSQFTPSLDSNLQLGPRQNHHLSNPESSMFHPLTYYSASILRLGIISRVEAILHCVSEIDIHALDFNQTSCRRLTAMTPSSMAIIIELLSCIVLDVQMPIFMTAIQGDTRLLLSNDEVAAVLVLGRKSSQSFRRTNSSICWFSLFFSSACVSKVTEGECAKQEFTSSWPCSHNTQTSTHDPSFTHQHSTSTSLLSDMTTIPGLCSVYGIISLPTLRSPSRMVYRLVSSMAAPLNNHSASILHPGLISMFSATDFSTVKCTYCLELALTVPQHSFQSSSRALRVMIPASASSFKEFFATFLILSATKPSNLSRHETLFSIRSTDPTHENAGSLLSIGCVLLKVLSLSSNSQNQVCSRKLASTPYIICKILPNLLFYSARNATVRSFHYDCNHTAKLERECDRSTKYLP
eukprot:scaffold51686_cov40-Cyclotella_meneghiniana.AAC.1